MQTFEGCFGFLDLRPLGIRTTPQPGCPSQMKVHSDSLLKMVHNPGGDEESASWGPGGSSKVGIICLFSTKLWQRCVFSQSTSTKLKCVCKSSAGGGRTRVT